MCMFKPKLTSRWEYLKSFIFPVRAIKVVIYNDMDTSWGKIGYYPICFSREHGKFKSRGWNNEASKGAVKTFNNDLGKYPDSRTEYPNGYHVLMAVSKGLLRNMSSLEEIWQVKCRGVTAYGVDHLWQAGELALVCRQFKLIKQIKVNKED